MASGPGAIIIKNISACIELPVRLLFTTSLINNRMGRESIRIGTSEVGSKVWDLWGGSLEMAWYRVGHPRAARSCAKRAF